jgi:hypothetical protein
MASVVGMLRLSLTAVRTSFAGDGTDQWYTGVVVTVTAVAGDTLYGLIAQRIRRRAQILRIADPKDFDKCHKGRVTSGQTPSSARIDRRADIQRLLKGFRQRGCYTCLVSETGTGTSSALIGMTKCQRAVIYVSLASCVTLTDVAKELSREFGLQESERMSLVARFIDKMLQTFRTDADAEVETEAEVWRNVSRTVADIAFEAGQQSEPPVIIFDQLELLEGGAKEALQMWASGIQSQVHVVLAVAVPFEFFSSQWSASMRVTSFDDPSVDEVVAYIHASCPRLSEEQCRHIILRYTGTSVGYVNRACQFVRDAEDCGNDAMDSMPHRFKAYFFAATHSFSLVCLQPTGNVELDEERLAIFDLGIALIDKQTLHPCTKCDHERTVCMAYLTFKEVYAIVPMPVHQRLLRQRNVIPLRTGFDYISLRAPFGPLALEWVLGVTGTPERTAAVAELEELRLSLKAA